MPDIYNAFGRVAAGAEPIGRAETGSAVRYNLG